MRELAERLQEVDKSTIALGVAIAGVAASIGPTLFIIGKLTAAIAFLTSPIGLVIVAIAALSAAILYIWVNWSAIVERISDWSWWKNMLIDMVQFFLDQNPFEHIIKAYNFLLRKLGRDEIKSPFQGMIESLEALKDDTQEYEHQFASMADTIKVATDKAKESISGMFSTGEATGFATATEAALDRVGFAYETAADRVQNAIAKMGITTVEGVKRTTEPLRRFADITDELAARINTAIVDMTESFFEGLSNMAVAGGGFAAVGAGLLSTLADIAVRMGRIIMAAGIGI